MRSLRSHTDHAKCLEDYMLEPPFGHTCAVAGCDRPVFYPGYNDDKKVLEMNYNNLQARKREVEDAVDMFNM